MHQMEHVHSLFAVLHSEVQKLIRVEGNSSLGISAKILSALEDGSLAVISPVTGLVLTIIYPLNTFQVCEIIYFSN